MIVESKTFPAKPPAIGKGPASGHKITARKPRGTCPLPQFGKIDAANCPMVKPMPYEAPDFRSKTSLRLCRITAKDFQIGCIGQRKEPVGGSFAGMHSAVDRSTINSFSEVAFALRQIGAIPDKMINAHGRKITC